MKKKNEEKEAEGEGRKGRRGAKNDKEDEGGRRRISGSCFGISSFNVGLSLLGPHDDWSFSGLGRRATLIPGIL